jgi:hypothetical protein
MNEKNTQGKVCNSDRNQRRNCVYFHERTGRCTMDAPQATWQDKGSQEQAKPR